MNVLLSLLQKSPDYMQLLQAVEAKQAAAVSGLSQAPRSHVLAALHSIRAARSSRCVRMIWRLPGSRRNSARFWASSRRCCRRAS